jgi:hypothetical protein
LSALQTAAEELLIQKVYLKKIKYAVESVLDEKLAKELAEQLRHQRKY